jgi:hypothetical protein
MIGSIVIIVLCLCLAGAGIWLARWSKLQAAPSKDLAAIFVETLPARYPRYFPVIRQALSESDAKFLAARVSPEQRRRARSARQAAALAFLSGLRQDYLKLSELARALVKYAPENAKLYEVERLRLEMRFNFLYGLVWLKLRTGLMPIKELGSLSDRIGGLAARLELAVHAWQDASLLPKLGETIV